MAAHYVASGYAFLSFNLRGHDCIAEGYRRDGEFRYVGGSLEPFATSIGDISAAIDLLTARGFRVAALQGHSLGCDRIVEFSLSTGRNYPLILIAPCDSYDLQRRYTEGRGIDEQRKELRAMVAGGSPRILFEGHYGVRFGDEDYYTPVGPSTLLSMIDGPPFKLFRYDSEASWSLGIPGLVVLGSNDSLLTYPIPTVETYFENAFQPVSFLKYDGAYHDFTDFEEFVAADCVRWLVLNDKT
jgi:hypothetical protein